MVQLLTLSIGHTPNPRSSGCFVFTDAGHGLSHVFVSVFSLIAPQGVYPSVVASPHIYKAARYFLKRDPPEDAHALSVLVCRR